MFSAIQSDAPPAPAKPKETSSQEITRPVPKIPLEANVPSAPISTTALPTVALPRMTAKPDPTDAAKTTAIPRPTPLNTPRPTPTAGMPNPLGSKDNTGPVPIVAPPTQTSAIPRAVTPPPVPGARFAPSQQTKPNPIAPGSAASSPTIPVETMSGPFPRAATPAPGTSQIPRAPTPPPRAPTPPPGAKLPAAPLKPPPGMTDADVNALHAKYVQAKQAIGEKVDERSKEKLLRTINQTAPKIMEQYKSAGVDFTVVVKDNQVVIKAKPKG
jgi:hypothetical protein